MTSNDISSNLKKICRQNAEKSQSLSAPHQMRGQHKKEEEENQQHEEEEKQNKKA